MVPLLVSSTYRDNTSGEAEGAWPSIRLRKELGASCQPASRTCRCSGRRGGAVLTSSGDTAALRGSAGRAATSGCSAPLLAGGASFLSPAPQFACGEPRGTAAGASAAPCGSAGAVERPGLRQAAGGWRLPALTHPARVTPLPSDHIARPNNQDFLMQFVFHLNTSAVTVAHSFHPGAASALLKPLKPRTF